MGNLGEIRGGVACWRTKAAISLKHVEIEEKLLWRAYGKSPTLFRTVPSPTPYGLPFPRLGVRNPTPKLQVLLSHEWLKLGTSNLAGVFAGSIRAQADKKILEKRERGRIQGLPKFFEYPLLSQERIKLRTSNFVRTFLVSIRTTVH